ncbi:MAG: hypothetical protein ACI4NC_07440 [Succinivibrio sp.]
MQSENLNKFLKYGGVAVVIGMAVCLFNLQRNYQKLKSAYESQPLVMVMNWDGFVKPSNFKNDEEQSKTIQQAREYLHQLENKGVIVVDGRYVNAVSDDFLITYDKFKKSIAK